MPIHAGQQKNPALGAFTSISLVTLAGIGVGLTVNELIAKLPEPEKTNSGQECKPGSPLLQERLIEARTIEERVRARMQASIEEGVAKMIRESLDGEGRIRLQPNGKEYVIDQFPPRPNPAAVSRLNDDDLARATCDVLKGKPESFQQSFSSAVRRWLDPIGGAFGERPILFNVVEGRSGVTATFNTQTWRVCAETIVAGEKRKDCFSADDLSRHATLAADIGKIVRSIGPGNGLR